MISGQAIQRDEPCRLCGGVKKIPVSQKDRHGNPLETVLCAGCGVITNRPIPSDDELAVFYREKYRTEYKGQSVPRMRQVCRNLRREHAHIRSHWEIYQSRKNCLDLGSGSGEFMFLLSRLGVKCLGVEPDQDYSAYCRDHLGLDIRTQTLEETDFPEGAFDFIRLSHVLEHMPDPVRSLRTLCRWLSDDGILFISVPNIEIEAERKMQGRLFHFGHIFNFNPYTLRLAARLAGMEEAPGCASRLGQTTGTFFVKGGVQMLPAEGAAANAALMKKAMDAHHSRIFPKPRNDSAIHRFGRMLRLRLSEMLQAQKFPEPRSIAEHHAAQLAKSCHPQGVL